MSRRTVGLIVLATPIVATLIGMLIMEWKVAIVAIAMIILIFVGAYLALS